MGKPVSIARKYKASFVSPTKEEEMNYQNSIKSSNNKENVTNKLYKVILSDNNDEEIYSKENINDKVEEKNDIMKQSLLIYPSTLHNSSFDTKDIELNDTNKPYENGIKFSESPSNIKNILEIHNISKALDFDDVDGIINLPMVHNSPYKSINKSADYNQYQHEDGNGNSNNNNENNEEIIEEEIIEEIIDDNNNDDDDDDDYDDEENIREEDDNDSNNEEDDEDEINDDDEDLKDNVDKIIEEEEESLYDTVNPDEEDSQCIEVYEDELETVNKENSTSWFNIDNYSFHILLAYVMLLLLVALIIYRIDQDGSIILSENKDVISLFQSTGYNNINTILNSNDKIDSEFNQYIKEVVDDAASDHDSTDNFNDKGYETNNSETELYIYSNDNNFDVIDDTSETAIVENENYINTNAADNQVLDNELVIEENLLLSDNNNEQVVKNSEIESVASEIFLQVVSNIQIVSDTDANDVITTLDVTVNEVTSDDQSNIDTLDVDAVVSAAVCEEVLENVIVDVVETNALIESVELVDIDITTTVDSITVDNILVVDETTIAFETNAIIDSETLVEDDLDHTASDLTIETISIITSDITLSPAVNVHSIIGEENLVVTNDKIYVNTDNDISDPTLVFICLVVTSISAIIGLLYISTFQKNDLNDLTNEIILDNEIAYLSNQSSENNSINTNPIHISLSWENDVKRSFDIPVHNNHFDNDFTGNSSHSSNSNLSYSVRRSERLTKRLHIS